MTRVVRLVSIWICLLFVLGLMPSAARVIHAAPQQTDTPTLPPLPHTCGDGLPDACCISGYVSIDGQPVLGAKLDIVSAHGTTETWTDYAADDPNHQLLPYYAFKLINAPPLSVTPGETITITVSYSSHTRTITHTVLEGPQRVDIVLPRSGSNDYVFDREIWKQGELGKFNFPTGIATDGAGTVYVVDWGNARVQAFDRDGGLLPGRAWGTRGSRPGLFSGPVGIAVDRFGYVYIADTFNYQVQKFTIAGEYVLSWGYQGAGNGAFNAPFGIAVDNQGDVYVTDSFNNRVQQFDSMGTWKATWGQQGTGTGEFNFPAGIAVDSDGNLYVSDRNNHRIQKRDTQGNWEIWGHFGSGILEFNYPEGLAVDTDFVYIADRGNARIQKLTKDGIYSTSWGTHGTNDNQFLGPMGVAVGGTNDLYVVDNESHRVQRFDRDGNQQLSWGSKADNNGQFSAPVGAAADANGNVFITEWENNRIQKFDRAGEWLTTWGQAGSQDKEFNKPTGIAVDSQENVFVADTGNHRIQKFDSNGHFLKSWNTWGLSALPLFAPTGIAVDTQGDVYVVDTAVSLVHKFSGDGAYIKSWGLPDNALLFNNPIGIAVEPDGQHLYVADTNNDRIVAFTDAGQVVKTWGSKGTDEGQFSGPTGIAIDQDKNIYVADSGSIFGTVDTGNHRIQKFNNTGDFLSMWGTPGGDLGQFANPVGLAVEGNGSVYVVDVRNNRVQHFHIINDTPPTATIVQAAPNPVQSPNPVALYGIGNVGNSITTIAAYEWTWSHDAITITFATTANSILSTAGLAPGDYIIHFRVQDSSGIYSEYQSVPITIVPSGAPVSETWGMLLYLNGDTHTVGVPGSLARYLGREPGGALYRLENADPFTVPPNVRVAALYDGDQNGDSSYYLSELGGRALTAVPAPKPEVDMGDPQTLVAFVRWAKAAIHADHYYLAIADHGNGLTGISWDYTSSPAGSEHLTNGKLRQAMLELQSGGAKPVDVLHLDACLMGLIEVAYQLNGAADYLIVSQNEAWGIFGYDIYRSKIEPLTSPQAFAQKVVLGYAQAAHGYPYTITALDLHAFKDISLNVNDVIRHTDTLAGELLRYALASQGNRTTLLQLRDHVQKFDSNGTIDITNDDAYIDLRHWAELLTRPENGVADTGVQNAAAALAQELQTTISATNVYTNSAQYDTINVNLDHAYGIGIYFPHQPNAYDYQTYSHGDLIFPTDTRWNEFLSVVFASLPIDQRAPTLHPVAPQFFDQ